MQQKFWSYLRFCLNNTNWRANMLRCMRPLPADGDVKPRLRAIQERSQDFPSAHGLFISFAGHSLWDSFIYPIIVF